MNLKRIINYSLLGAALMALLGLYSALLPAHAGIYGRWCSDDAVRISCYRDWISALSGWAAAAGALVAAKIAYDSFISASVESRKTEIRHQQALDLQQGPKREALLRAHSGVVMPMESAILRTTMLGLPPGFGGLGGLGGAPTSDHKEILEDVFSTISDVLDSKPFAEAAQTVTTDIHRTAQALRRILNGAVPPSSPLFGWAVSGLRFDNLGAEDRSRLDHVKRYVTAITSVIRQEMIAAGLLEDRDEDEEPDDEVDRDT